MKKCKICKISLPKTNRSNMCLRDRKRQYYLSNKEKIDAYTLDWQRANADKTAAAYKKWKQGNIEARLAIRLRKRIYMAINNNKPSSAVKDLGCTLKEFKSHLESKFQPGMAWDNWSYNGWHIDHVKPLSSFNLSNKDEFKKACHYSNLQPLWAKENLSKGRKKGG